MGQQVDRLGVADMSVARKDSASLSVEMTVKPSLLRLGTDRLMRVTPVLRSADGQFEKELPSYSIAGKNQPQSRRRRVPVGQQCHGAVFLRYPLGRLDGKFHY